MKQQKFSILEVIVVIAIILTLASMLFASLRTSRDLALRAQCMSNLAQVRNFTELYRKDFGQAPDPRHFNAVDGEWWRDFSYAAPYLHGGTKALAVFHCPGDEGNEVTTIAQLNGGTSYYYVPSRKAVLDELFDNDSMSPLSWPQMADKNFLVIYDRSKGFHNGWRNIAYLFGDDRPESGSIVSVVDGDDDDDDDEIIDFPLDDPEPAGDLNINPNNSDGSLFIVYQLDGSTTVIRDDVEENMGMASKIIIKVKAQGRNITVGGQNVTLATNKIYEFTATADESGETPYFYYDLRNESNSGNGNGHWWVKIYPGVGTISISEHQSNSGGGNSGGGNSGGGNSGGGNSGGGNSGGGNSGGGNSGGGNNR